MEVRLRPYRAEDEGALTDAARESVDELFPWMPWCHPGFSHGEARAWIEKQIVAWQQRSEFEFCIVDAAESFLGACGINQINNAHRFGNVGYWVRTSATGRGIATAAIRQLLDFAQRETDLVRLELVVAVGNNASARVAQKVGAHLDGVLPARLHLHGLSHDSHVYSVVLNRA